MSSSMARTAPASCAILASVLTDIEAPTTNTSEPSLRIPNAERHTKVWLPTVLPYVLVVVLFTSGEIVPFSTSRPRFWRTAATSGPGAASMVLYKDGHVDVVNWQAAAPGPDVAAVRQSLGLLVENGTISPEVNSTTTSTWGKTVGNHT